MKKVKDEMLFAEPEEPVETIVEEEVVAEELADEYPEEYPEEGTVIAKMLAVRQEASQTSLMIRVLYKDEKINYKKLDDEWYAISDGGFVMSKFIR